MIQLNFYLVFATALIPLLVGFIWYHPKVFGNVWMKAAGVNMPDEKKPNMFLIFLLTYILGIVLSVAMYPTVIHQMGVFSTLEKGLSAKDPDVTNLFNDLMSRFGNEFRSFKHGVLHGIISAIVFAMPLMTINALFEGKGIKYILVNLGYWIITLALIGGVICQHA